jgi:anti-sigma B factor antagonist
MEGIQVSTEVRGSQNQISLIKVGGFIDTTTSSEVERALHNLLKQNRYNIIIDLGNVDYISSAGWGIFISEIKSIREQTGDLKLVRMIPDVYEIFELLEFHHILDVYDSIDEAVRRFEDNVPRPTAASVTREFVEVRRTPVGSSTPTAPFNQRRSVFQTEVEEEEPVFTESIEPKMPPREMGKSVAKLEDKIKNIIAQNPDLSAYKIKKVLNTSKFGYTRVGWFSIRSILKNMGLGSRKSRKEFAQKSSKAVE